MNFLENITFRRARTHSDTNDQSVNLSETLEGTTSSLPDISDDYIEEKNKLQEQNEELSLQLKSAHAEIETLLLENKGLKQQLSELTKNNDLLKKITHSPVKPKVATPKHKQNLQTKNKQTQTFSCTKSLQNTCVSERDKEVSFIKNLVEPTQMTVALDNIKQSTHTVQNIKHIIKRKLCIISTNNYNKILSIAENTISKNSELCHYITPNCGATPLLNGLHEKTRGFTKNDFCIIMIGEEDFFNETDYLPLIFHIRSILQDIKHTNIILCVPTFKYGLDANSYNLRVQYFNNLLNLDILSYKHAYLFDSNKSLTYDYTMFRRRSGTINNYGIRTIFDHLTKYIMDIQRYNDIPMQNEPDFQQSNDINTYNGQQKLNKGQEKGQHNINQEQQFFLK